MKLREDLVLRRVGKDHVIVDPGQDMVDMSKVFTLNDSAAWLWNQLMGNEFTSEGMLNLLLEQYDVSKEQALEDVNVLIGIFKENGLLK